MSETGILCTFKSTNSWYYKRIIWKCLPLFPISSTHDNLAIYRRFLAYLVGGRLHWKYQYGSLMCWTQYKNTDYKWYPSDTVTYTTSIKIIQEHVLSFLKRSNVRSSHWDKLLLCAKEHIWLMRAQYVHKTLKIQRLYELVIYWTYRTPRTRISQPHKLAWFLVKLYWVPRWWWTSRINMFSMVVQSAYK